MANELTTKIVDFPALAPNSRQGEIIRANLDGEPMSEMDLVRVRCPLGGATKWSVEIDGNSETADELVGILVGIGKRGVLWPAQDPSESRPVIVSHDLITGYRVSDEIGDLNEDTLERYRIGDRRYDWAKLASSPEYGYGSARSGAGKRCKESRILALLRQGETWPILVSIGPGSLRNFLPFAKRLPCFPWEAVVGLKLAKAKGRGGQPYSSVAPRLVGMLTPEQGEVCRRTYAEPIKAMFTAPPIGAVEVATEVFEEV
jgi:hypothetical protein